MFVANLKEGQLGELLHIPEPWYIDRVDFSLATKQFDVFVKFRRHAYFHAPIVELWTNR
jgi:transposase